MSLQAGTAGWPRPERILFCFALKQEARFFNPGSAPCLITGIGPQHAQCALREALVHRRIECVVSAGFAGGLNPSLRLGTVLFDTDHAAGYQTILEAVGAQPARFLSVDRMLITAEAKTRLRRETGADAVEMESAALRAVALEHGLPCLTVRVVSDPADESLPLDFNALYTPDFRLDAWRLARELIGAPRKIPALWQLASRTRLAARALAAVLNRLIECEAVDP